MPARRISAPAIRFWTADGRDIDQARLLQDPHIGIKPGLGITRSTEFRLAVGHFNALDLTVHLNLHGHGKGISFRRLPSQQEFVAANLRDQFRQLGLVQVEMEKPVEIAARDGFSLADEIRRRIDMAGCANGDEQVARL